ncbi:hypothetical protein GLYMA_11G145436v4 [Glycine max]|nr:hypothetical protein GLYMA_11G145436v4 [Glycine max]KAH1140801.1 hypothetical protein GYH30_057325 [Glycine max]
MTNCSSCSDNSSSRSKPSPAFAYRSETSSNWSKNCSNSKSSISSFCTLSPAKNTSLSIN